MPLYRWELIRRKKPLIGPQIHDVSQLLYLPFDKDHEPYSVEPYNPTQVLRLPFEDPPQEITYDRSGHGNDGTIYGATRVIGRVRNALSFDGVDDYVEVSHKPELNLLKSHTIMFWMYPRDVLTTQALFEKTFVSPETSFSWAMNIGVVDRRAQYLLESDPPGAGRILTNQTDLAANVWHHIASTWDESTVKIYLNGVLDASAPYVGTRYATTGPLHIGRPSPLNAVLDEIRIYSRALSQAEIKRLMYLRGV